MPGGRPTDYNKDVLTLAEEYYENFEEAGDMIPSLDGLSLVLGKTRQTLYNWSEKHDEFFDILEKINAKQKVTLINKGLSGEFNSNIAKLALGKHGLHDRVDSTSSDGSMTPKENSTTIVFTPVNSKDG